MRQCEGSIPVIIISKLVVSIIDVFKKGRSNLKKCLSVFLVFAMMVSLFAVNGITVFAYEASGKCGDNITWIVIDDVLEINGYGEMWNNPEFNDPTYDFPLNDEIREIRMNGEITSIGSSAFTNCYQLTKVSLPLSLTTIGNAAFSQCLKLESITIPDSVVSIGKSAFNSCPLKSIVFPNTLKVIGENAFRGCKMSSIIIPNSVTDIGDNAFRYCSDLNTVELPDSLTNLGAYSFSGCGLTTITIPDSVSSIGDYAFSECHKLTNVSIGKSVTSVGKNIFNKCENIENVTVGSINAFSEAFQYFGSTVNIKTISIGGSITSIEDYAFSNNLYGSNLYSLKSVIIGDSVVSINREAFFKCYALESIAVNSQNKKFKCIDGDLYDINGTTLICSVKNKQGKYVVPSSVTSIYPYTFAGCGNLTSITIPNSVTSIGSQAFLACNKLTDVYYDGSEEDWKNLPELVTTKTGVIRASIALNSNVTVHFSDTPASSTIVIDCPAKLVGSTNTNGIKIQFTAVDGTKVSGDIVNGSAEVAITEGSSYAVTISKPGFTSYTVKKFVVGTDSLPENIELYGGDFNGDNVINAKDNALLAEAFGKRDGQNGFNELADLNGDGIINAKDKAVVSTNFTKRGVNN